MFSLWRYKTAWITNIIHGTIITCDETKLNRIKNLMSGMAFLNELLYNTYQIRITKW